MYSLGARRLHTHRVALLFERGPNFGLFCFPFLRLGYWARLNLWSKCCHCLAVFLSASLTFRLLGVSYPESRIAKVICHFATSKGWGCLFGREFSVFLNHREWTWGTEVPNHRLEGTFLVKRRTHRRPWDWPKPFKFLLDDERALLWWQLIVWVNVGRKYALGERLVEGRGRTYLREGASLVEWARKSAALI